VSPDLHTLTGAYAVDALPDDEREVFEAHLAVCEACAQEVAELVATAARLGAASVSAPPAGLREAVLSQLPDIRQEPPAGSASPTAAVRDDEPTDDVTARRRRTSRPWVANLMAPAAAVAAIAVLGLAAVVANLNDRLDQVETSSTQMSSIVAAPDARWIDVPDSDAEMARVVVAPSRGEAMFMVDGMPAPDEGSNYVLWLIGEDGPAPAGAFEVDERGRASRVITGDLAATDLIGVTVEPADVAPVEPSSDPIMAVDLGTT
jgi:anti-sigma factor RsiW